ncbi:hypothetical protein [Pseudomonas sp. MAG002Y]|uniref:AbiTii domain-containing protein n=1 Tax=Pseudomonas sp. MAG002Y TaxID=2678690 RepID=UPI001C60CBB4|nr:hypothetical protein [Pseudomonas sp. MAG002Y]MBW5416307.1 hypothetical protein [Pseudomonas sp. MAG002Y]
MSSLVLELQRDALDKGIHVTNLLRKALLVSRKLKIKDIEEWITSELNGYEDMLPDYRVVRGEVKAFNPYRGWIPVYVNEEWHDLLCKQNVWLSVSQIENLIEGTETGTFTMKYAPGPSDIIRKLIGQDFQPALFVPVHHLVRMIDTVKTKVMEFALDLEERGILGEGITFSVHEQKVAQNITYNTINIQRMTNSQIQQDTFESDQFN